MKSALENLVADAIAELADAGEFALDAPPAVSIERARNPEHGDFASPVALGLARTLKRRPRDIAEAIVAHLADSPRVAAVELAGPGFINFRLADTAYHEVVREVLAAGPRYGRGTAGQGTSVQVEFVSATPTGPLHVGHGRGAAFGAALANVLDAAGFEVQREYYINDAGRQMDILALSVWLRYLEAHGETPPFPASAYQGAYIRDIAATLGECQGDAHVRAAAELSDGLPADEADGGDKEKFVDAAIARMRALLGADGYREVFRIGLDHLVGIIRTDLADFGVEFDRWYSEASLGEGGAIERAIERLTTAGHTFTAAGALWFRSTAFGDDKDRVIVRENGVPTYFASDIAYHMEKFERGFDRVIDVWGADHHGYIARVKGSLAALGRDADAFEVPVVQMVHLYRGGEKAFMSTRRGEFVTLRQLREEVGNDAAHFFYVSRKCDQHLDFDLELAKSRSSDNPVYYVQYAHARICSVLQQAADKGMALEVDPAEADLSGLVEAHERALFRTLARYPEVVESAALAREPHQIVFFVRELANELHTYYNAHQFLVDDATTRNARLVLVSAVRQVLANGLALVGVSAPASM